MKRLERHTIIRLTLLLLLLFVGGGGLAAYAIVNWNSSTTLATPIRWERAIPPTIVHPNWTSFTHANQVNDVAVRDNLLWAATDGGIVAWELQGEQVVKYTTEHGLAANRVRSLAFGNDGVLWVATANGIGRFDGQQWQAYREAEGLVDNDVRDIAVSREGNVWAGTANGVSRYNGRSWRTFQTGQFLSGLPSHNVRTLAVSENGRLWVGTDAGVAEFDGRFWQSHTLANGLNSNNILHLALGENGRLWAATDVGLNYYNGQRWESFAGHPSLPARPISALASGADNGVWLAQETSLLRFDGNSSQTMPLWDAPLQALWREGGTIWGATPSGVVEFDGTAWQTWAPPSDLPAANINDLAQTNDGIWLASERGIGRFDGSKWELFTTDNGLVDNRVAALATTSNGNLWAAHPHAALGLGRFDGQRWYHLPCTLSVPPSRHITASLEAADGTLWFGTDIGLVRGAENRWELFTTVDGLPSNEITSLAEADGSLYVATTGGLAQLSQGDWQTVTTEAVVQVSSVTASSVWLLLNNGTLAHFVDNELVPTPLPFDATIRQISAADDGIWLATSAGVAHLGINWRLFTTQDGLTATDVTSIAHDGQGRLWAGSSGDNQAFFFNWFDGQQWQEHPNRDPANEVLNGNLVQAILPTPDGSVWLGGARSGIQRASKQGWQSYEVEDVLPLTADVLDMTFALNKVWALTQNGLLFFDGQTWHAFGATHTNNVNRPQHLATDGQGDLWVSPSNFAEGLRHFDGLGWEIIPTWRERSQLATLDFGPDGRLWVSGWLEGSNQGFLGVFDGINWFWHFFPTGQPLSLSIVASDTAWVGLNKGPSLQRFRLADNGVFHNEEAVNNIAFPEQMKWVNGRLFVGGGDRIHELTDGQWQEYEVPIPFVRHIFALEMDKNGRLWVGTEQGVAIFDGSSWQSFYAPPRSPRSWGAVETMLVREDEGIAFGTTRGGVGLFTGRGFTGDRNPAWGQEDFTITSLLFDQNSQLWVGTDGEGLARLNERGWQTFASDPALSAAVQSLGVAADGTAWIGTSAGLVPATNLTDESCTFGNIQAEVNGISALLDTEGAVWFGTAAHGAIRQGLGGQAAEPRWEDSPVPHLALDPDGTLWFVPQRHNWLTRLGNGRSARVPLDQEIATANEITAIQVASNLTVWLGTTNGLVRFDGQSWTKLETDVGLADNVITDLLIASDSTLWIATEGGISHYRP